MGGKSKTKAPPAPDYTALMKQQQAADLATYQKQLADQRTTTNTAMGSSSWTQDANGNWVNNQTLSPELQQLYNQQLANQGQAMNVQSQANQQLQDLMNKGAWQGPALTAQYSQDYANNYADQMEKTLTARLQPQYTQDQNAMQTKLSLQGLQPGTEAYDRAYQNLLRSQGDVMSQANLQAQLAGQSEARNQYQTELAGQEAARTASMQDYLLPWQTASAAQGLAGSINMPSFQTTTSTPGLQTPGLMGAAQQTYAQQMQNANQASQKSSGKGQSLGSIAGGIAGAYFGGPVGAAAGSSIGGAAGGALFG